MERNTVVLATYGSSVGHAHGACMDALKNEVGMLTISTQGSSQIDMARSQLACLGLAHGADVVVFIDHDILFDPLDVAFIAETARDVKGVVGAPYSQRKMGAGIVGSFAPGTEEAVFFEGGDLYPASGALGMGFTAIHRSAFERLDGLTEYAVVNSQEGTIRPYFKKLVVNGYWLKEDASFCHAVRSVGVSTMLDTRIRVKHLGEHPFGIEDCVRVSQDSPTMRMRLRAG